jgi:hypothetical protein
MAGSGVVVVLVVVLALVTTSAWARRTAIAVGREAAGSTA